MQQLDIPAPEHGLGQAAKTLVCVLEGGRQCPLGGAAMLCQEQKPGTFIVYFFFQPREWNSELLHVRQGLYH